MLPTINMHIEKNENALQRTDIRERIEFTRPLSNDILYRFLGHFCFTLLTQTICYGFVMGKTTTLCYNNTTLFTFLDKMTHFFSFGSLHILIIIIRNIMPASARHNTATNISVNQASEPTISF